MKLTRKKMSFDLRQRCRMTAELIETIRDKKSLRILDAGGREGYLHNYLPDDRIFTLDLKFFPGKQFAVGDLLLLPFASGTFDLTVSLDVMEHIDPGQRSNLLDEMDRVCRDHLIIGAPFFDGRVVEAEKLVNYFYRQATGRENEFLSEHLRLGLPQLEEVTAWIERKNYRAVSLPNNYLPFWVVMMGLSAYFSSFPQAEGLIAAVTDLYDLNLSEYDSQSPAYRKIFLVAKSGSLDKEKIRQQFTPPPFSEESRKKTWDFAEGILAELSSFPERAVLELQKENQRLQSEIVELEHKFQTIQTELEGIKSTVVYRLFKRTWGRLRDKLK